METILNNSDEDGQLSLIPDLKETFSTFSPLILMLPMVLCCMFLIILRSLFSTILLRFYHEWVLDFVKIFLYI